MRALWVTFWIAAVLYAVAATGIIGLWVNLYIPDTFVATLAIFVIGCLYAHARNRRRVVPIAGIVVGVTTFAIGIVSAVVSGATPKSELADYLPLLTSYSWRATLVCCAMSLFALLQLRVPWHQRVRQIALYASPVYLFVSGRLLRTFHADVGMPHLLFQFIIHFLFFGFLIYARKRAARSLRLACDIGIIAVTLSLASVVLDVRPSFEFASVVIYLTYILVIILFAFVFISALTERLRWLPRRDDFRSVSFTCPQCDTTQQIAPGDASCESCGLRIHLEVEVPRCACGYRLYGRNVDACPECGRAVDAPPTERE